MTIVVHLSKQSDRSIVLELDKERSPNEVRNILTGADQDLMVTELIKISSMIRKLRENEKDRMERKADFTISDDFITERLA